MPKLTYVISRGRLAGTVLTPHRFEDRLYRAHRTSSRNDPIGKRVASVEELVDLVRLGYRVRMSNVSAGHPPSTVMPVIA